MGHVTAPSVEQIISVMVRLLAEERGEQELEVRASLEDGGWELPIDSLRIVEILTRVEVEFGVEIPAEVDSARSMRSVRSFAEIVHAAVVTGVRSARS
jgi:acyl carrier protein